MVVASRAGVASVPRESKYTHVHSTRAHTRAHTRLTHAHTCAHTRARTRLTWLVAHVPADQPLGPLAGQGMQVLRRPVPGSRRRHPRVDPAQQATHAHNEACEGGSRDGSVLAANRLHSPPSWPRRHAAAYITIHPPTHPPTDPPKHSPDGCRANRPVSTRPLLRRKRARSANVQVLTHSRQRVQPQ